MVYVIVYLFVLSFFTWVFHGAKEWDETHRRY